MSIEAARGALTPFAAIVDFSLHAGLLDVCHLLGQSGDGSLGGAAVVGRGALHRSPPSPGYFSTEWMDLPYVDETWRLLAGDQFGNIDASGIQDESHKVLGLLVVYGTCKPVMGPLDFLDTRGSEAATDVTCDLVRVDYMDSYHDDAHRLTIAEIGK